MDADAKRQDLLHHLMTLTSAEDASLSRRRFLQVGGISIIGLSALAPGLVTDASPPVLVLAQAQGLVIADPTKCVGCRRCELACTEFNDGKAAPSMARVKVARNMNFGPAGASVGRQGQGTWGNGLVVQSLCRQCPNPVPCASACPQQAIVAKPPTYARVVDPEKCVGCGTCLTACPWVMPSIDDETGKAVKCTLCDGRPKCVEACPAASLRYVAWRDLTRLASARSRPESPTPTQARDSSFRARPPKRRDA
jgi:Fe-S-cluster-containing dehydrogenase component